MHPARRYGARPSCISRSAPTLALQVAQLVALAAVALTASSTQMKQGVSGLTSSNLEVSIRGPSPSMPRLSMWWWSPEEVVLGSASEQANFIAEFERLGGGDGSTLYAQASKLITSENRKAMRDFAQYLSTKGIKFHFLMTTQNRSMDTAKALSFIEDVGSFAVWANMPHPVVHFDLEPSDDRGDQTAYLGMLPHLVAAAKAATPAGWSGGSLSLHFDTQHRMGGIYLPCPLLGGLNVSMVQCVLAAGNITMMDYSSQWHDFKIFVPPCSSPTTGCTIQGIVNYSMWTLQAAQAANALGRVTIGVQTDCMPLEPWTSFCKTNLSFVQQQLEGAGTWFRASPFAPQLSDVPFAMECFANFRKLK